MKNTKLFILLFSFPLLVFAREEIIKRKYYTLSYNEDHEVANWVSYELEKNNLQNCAKRSNNFRVDPNVSTGSATLKDYANSGYDRGHLVPAGDMKITSEAMKDTFFMSNMTPQPGNFNRGKWSQLETLMRAWASKYQKIWIVTGPVLEKGLPTIGRDNQVAVPDKYFKVILRQNGGSYTGIAFLMETTVPYNDLKAYTMSINEAEEIAQIDFFQFLDNRIEEQVEGNFDVKSWDFNAKFEYLPCQASVAQ
ncbi:DNA/RNA non-specific endonuclease [Peredibacter sp. HCB2-198]|uniref:DNA/RNA non-specific endonuclease n=1 Tax=Peredibacter sp. HCB2-198 TaxID=3383025 RepID=UPI0038B4E6DD